MIFLVINVMTLKLIVLIFRGRELEVDTCTFVIGGMLFFLVQVEKTKNLIKGDLVMVSWF